jgi:metallo-beta-lactamase class B
LLLVLLLIITLVLFSMMKFALRAIFFLLSVKAYSQNQNFKIATAHIVDNIYICTSFGLLSDGKTVFPANSMYIITDAGVILIDTPWSEDQTRQLIALLQKRYNKKVVLCISTHFHADRVAGLDVLKKCGAKTYTSALTKQLAKQNGEKQPEFTFTNDTTFRVGNVTLQTFYPGEGHTRDNIVVWLPKSKVLYAGCLIKSLDADDIGNVADGNLKAYPLTVKNLEAHFKNVKYVIPGHQGWAGDTLMLSHTLTLLKQ